MTENDYLAATNLAKLRVAEHVLREVLFMELEHGVKIVEAVQIVKGLRQVCEAKVK